MAANDDLLVDELRVFQNDPAKVAEVLPDAALNHVPAACASHKALLEGGVAAERGVGATLNNRLQPVDSPVVLDGFPSAKEELDFGKEESWK